MTVKNPPVWLEGGTYTSEDDRLVTSLLVDRTLASNKTSLLALEGGVVPPFNQLQVTTQSSNMTVSVSSGTVLVPRVSLDPPGVYVCHNQGVATVTLSNATTSPRIDIIVARVQDTTQGDSGSVWSLEPVMGTEAATPVAPQITGSAIPLAQVRVVPAAQNGGINKINTSQITDLRVFTTGLGGTHLVWGTHPNPAPSPGRFMYDVPNSSLYIANGTNFHTVPTLNELKSYFAGYRPQQVTHTEECSTSQTDFDSGFRDDATPASTDPIPVKISGLTSPSGDFIVHLSVLGSVSTADTVGYSSVQVKRTDNNTVVADNASHKGPSFYSTNWVPGQVTSLISTGTRDIPCSFTVFARVTGGGRISMKRIKLVVEPVL